MSMRITAFVKYEKAQVIFSIIFELLILGIGGIILLWISNNFIIQNPSIPLFRLISSLASILILTLFLTIKKPSLQNIGLSLTDVNRKSRWAYLIGLILIVLLFVTSFFFMDFFDIAQNIRFGIFCPIFEEIIFRGYIWHKLENNNYHNISIIFITGALFGLFHLAYYYEIAYATSFFKDAPSMFKILQNKVLINIGYGFLLGFIRYKSKNLYLTLIIHSIGNILGK